ncbi:MAG: hypothetical protein Edafosvirus1_124 [Edafosvirus sp.]|uniref:Uncharacterized protein n=1 Tax=Edafosvirus sp. TaxID=2487765 RepID=A0A3G4ZVZ9_9VIRU|nr:MAG: hypothetical protein Edafosvirus1_124 [Edafosvirus sp.]
MSAYPNHITNMSYERVKSTEENVMANEEIKSTEENVVVENEEIKRLEQQKSEKCCVNICILIGFICSTIVFLRYLIPWITFLIGYKQHVIETYHEKTIIPFTVYTTQQFYPSVIDTKLIDILNNNTNLPFCDNLNITDPIESYNSNKCQYKKCGKYSDCKPCQYQYYYTSQNNTVDCLSKSKQVGCIDAMSKYKCSISFTENSSLYVCYEYPLNAISPCKTSCPDIMFTPYDLSCECKTCSLDEYHIYTFTKNNMIHVNMQFGYMIKTDFINLSPVILITDCKQTDSKCITNGFNAVYVYDRDYYGKPYNNTILYCTKNDPRNCTKYTDIERPINDYQVSIGLSCLVYGFTIFLFSMIHKDCGTSKPESLLPPIEITANDRDSTSIQMIENPSAPSDA